MTKVSRSVRHSGLNPNCLSQGICISLSSLRSTHWYRIRCEREFFEEMSVKNKESRELIGRETLQTLVCAQLVK